LNITAKVKEFESEEKVDSEEFQEALADINHLKK